MTSLPRPDTACRTERRGPSRASRTRRAAWQVLCWAVCLVAAAWIAAAPAQAQLADGPWPKPFADLRNTNQSSTLEQVSDADANVGEVRSPIVTGPNGTLIYKQLDVDLGVINLQAVSPDGTFLGQVELWANYGSLTNEEQQVALSSPIVGPDGTVYVAAPSTEGVNAVFGIPVADLRDSQQSSLGLTFLPGGGASVSAAPSIGASGNLYVSTTASDVVGYDLAGGSVAWSVALDGTPGGSPIVAPDGRILVASRNGGIFAIPPGGTGGESPESLIEAGQVVDKNLALGKDGYLYAIASGDPEDGGSPDPVLYAVDINSGDGAVWTHNITTGVPNGVAIGPSGDVYYTTTSSQSGDSQLHRIFRGDGTPAWAEPTSIAGPVSAPSVYDAIPVIYVASAASQSVQTFYGGDGTLTGTVSVGTTPTSGPPLVAQDGNVVAGTTTGILLRTRPVPALDALSFGSLSVSAPPSQRTTALTPGAGTGTIEILDVQVIGTDAADFSVANRASLIGSETSGTPVDAQVEFAPTVKTAGTRSATLEIKTSIGYVTASLTGTASQPEASVTPNPLDFGDVDVSNTKTLQLTVENTGTEAITIQGLLLTGDATKFSTSLNSSTVSAGGSETIDVVFDPGTSGTYSANAEIDFDVISNVNVTLSGRGVSSDLVASSDPLSFSDTPINTSTSQSLSLTAVDSDIDVNGVTISGTNPGAFSVNSADVPNRVSSGNTDSFPVTFAPSTQGAKTASLDFDTSIGPISVALEGNATAAVLDASLSVVDVGGVEVGESKQVTLDLSNVGDLALDLSSATWSFTGDDASAFTVVSGNSGTLSSGGTAGITIEFAPTTAGPQTASLEVNALSLASFSIDLSGTGLEPDLSTSTTSLAYGDTKLGTAVTQSVDLTNTGDADLELTDVSISGTYASDFALAQTETGTLAAGATQSVEVTFTPSATGTRSAQLDVTTDETNLSAGISLSGTGVAPDLTTSTSALDFGTIEVGTTATQTVTLSNPTTVDVVLDGYTLQGADQDAFTISTSVGGATLSGGSDRSIQVDFQPSAAGTYSAQLVVEAEGGSLTRTIDLSGDAQSSALTASPTPLDFPNVEVGATAQLDVTLTNTLSTDVTVSGASISGTDASEFSVSGSSFTIAGGSSATLTVSYTPSAEGTDAASLDVAYDTGNLASSLSIPLSGAGTLANFDLSSSTLDFGDVKVNSASGELTVDVTNSSSSDVDLTDIRIGGTNAADFAITTGDISSQTRFSNGETRTLGVTFTPGATGTRSAQLLVETTNGINASVSLTGNGVAPDLAVSPTSITYGQVETGTSQVQTVTVTNPTTVPVDLTNLSLQGTNAADFAITGGTTGTIAAGGSQAVDVSFAPGATGSLTAQLVVEGEGGDVTRVVDLSGTGTAPQLSLSATSIAYGDVKTGATVTGSVDVSNLGDADLALTDLSISGTNASDFALAETETGTLAADATQSVEVTFTPSAAGTRSAQLSITTDETDLSATVDLTGTGVAPDLTASTSALDFGTIEAGTSASQTVTLTNPTVVGVDLTGFTLQGTDPGAFAITSGGATGTLSGGSDRIVEVSFQPSANGTFSAQLVVEAEGGSLTRTIDLSGTAESSALAASPSPLDFPSTQVSTTAQLDVTLTNTLSTDVTVTGVSISGTDAGDFSTAAGSSSIAAGGTQAVTVSYTPSADGTDAASLDVAYDTGTATGVVQVPLSGVGVSATLDVSAATLDYGDRKLGVTTAEQTVVVTNSTSADITLSDVRIEGTTPGDYTLTTGGISASTVLAAGASRTLGATFTPGATGTRSASLVVEASGTIAASVSLTGTGVAPALSVSPNAVDYGTIDASSTLVETVVVTNPTTVPVDLTGLSLQGSNASFFAITSGSPGTLSAGTSTNVEVTFQPTGPGAFAAQLVAEADGGAVTKVVDLTAVAQTGLTAAETQLAFNSRVDGSAAQTLTQTFSNPNVDAVTVSDVSVSGSGSAAFQVVSGGGGGSITSGGSYTVEVAFDPSSPGDYSASLDVTTSLGTRSTPLNGTVLPRPALSPSTADFGTVDVGSTASLALSVENAAGATLTVDSARVQGADASEFAVASTFPVTVAASSSGALDLTYAPTTEGSATASITVYSRLDVNGSSQSIEQTVDLTGSAVRPAELSVSTTQLDFGALASGQVEASRSVTLRNTGGQPLEITGVQVGDRAGAAGGAFGVPDGLAGSLPVGEAQTFTVSAAPQSPGDGTAVLSIQSNAGTATVSLAVLSVDLTFSLDEARLGEPASATLTLPSYSPTDQRTLYVRQSGGATYTAIQLEEQDATTWTATVPASLVTLRGIDYYLVLSNGTRTVSLPKARPAASSQAPVHVRVSFDRLEARGPFAPRSHRMVSIPAVLDDPSVSAVFEDDYGTYDPTVWRLTRFDPSLDDYREGQGVSNPVPGMAAWLITREGRAFDAGAGRSVDASRPIEITLDPGWNQIASPFAFAVRWADVSNTDALQAPVAYDGGEYRYGRAELDPWTGAWVYNPSPQSVTVSVPPVAAATAPQRLASRTTKSETDSTRTSSTNTSSTNTAGTNTSSTQTSSTQASEASADSSSAKRLWAGGSIARTPARPEDGYTLQLSARLKVQDRPVMVDRTNYLGLRDRATDGLDALDFAEAPPVGEHVRVSIIEGGTRLAGSYRPPGRDGQAWTVEVSAHVDERFATKKAVDLRLHEHGTPPAGYNIYVFDLDRRAPLSVKNGNVTVDLTRDAASRTLRIVAGTEQFAKTKSDDIPLEQLETGLSKTYPNPFRESATIEYELSQEEHVVLEVYDVLGRRVQTLVDERRSAGPHTKVWDGSTSHGGRLASGIYFVRLRAGDFTDTRKMTLVR